MIRTLLRSFAATVVVTILMVLGISTAASAATIGTITITYVDCQKTAVVVTSSGWAGEPSDVFAVRVVGDGFSATVPINTTKTVDFGKVVDPVSAYVLRNGVQFMTNNSTGQSKATASVTQCVTVLPASVSLQKKTCDSVSYYAQYGKGASYPLSVQIRDEKATVIAEITAEFVGMVDEYPDNPRDALVPYYRNTLDGSATLSTGHTYTAYLGMIWNGKWYPLKAISSAVDLTASCVKTAEAVKPSVEDPCGPGNAVWILPKNTESVTYSLNDKKEAIATANGGFEFSPNVTELNYGVAPDSGAACYVPPVQTPAPTPTATTPVPTPSNTTPVTTPTPKTTTPPVAPKPVAKKMVTRTFQVDKYKWNTLALGKKAATFPLDGVLGLREDMPFYGKSNWILISVVVPADATTAQLIAAINAKTPANVGDISTTSRSLTVTKSRGSVTMAWELGKGATIRNPWGVTKRVNQVFIGRSIV